MFAVGFGSATELVVGDKEDTGDLDCVKDLEDVFVTPGVDVVDEELLRVNTDDFEEVFELNIGEAVLLLLEVVNEIILLDDVLADEDFTKDDNLERFSLDDAFVDDPLLDKDLVVEVFAEEVLMDDDLVKVLAREV